jgi:hypothetical protein
MRIESIKAWMLVGFGLLLIGMLLYMFEVTEGGKLAKFVAVMGLVYFGIGVLLTLMHDRHMTSARERGENDEFQGIDRRGPIYNWPRCLTGRG